MNYNVLSKLKVVSANPEEVLYLFKSTLAQTRPRGLAESVFYLSASDPQDFYALSFWYALQDWEATTEKLQPGLSRALGGKAELLEQHHFRLIWETRQMHLSPVASNIRLMTFPDNFPQERIDEMVKAGRRQKHLMPGMVASWLGQSVSGKPILFHRVDWVSLEAQQNFFKANEVQQSIADSRAAGISLEYASFNLRGLVQPEAEQNQPLAHHHP